LIPADLCAIADAIAELSRLACDLGDVLAALGLQLARSAPLPER
jgi:hypothetical protein